MSWRQRRGAAFSAPALTEWSERQGVPDGDAKTMTTRALACNPIDFVSDAETVRVQQNLIS